MRAGKGQGPCSRRHVGEYGRRLVNDWHVTKGRKQWPAPKGCDILFVPPGPPRQHWSVAWERMKRNAPRASVPGSIRRAKEARAHG